MCYKYQNYFSFNFQKTALDIYNSILNKENSSIYKIGILSGLLFGIGDFLTYVSRVVLMKCAFEFMKRETLSYGDMLCALNVY